MINVIIILIIAICVFFGIKSSIKHLKGEGGCCGGGSSSVNIKPLDKNRKNYKYDVQIKIPDITCAKCIQKVSNALNSQDGIWAVKINLKSKTAHVLLKNNITQEQVKSIIANTGYSIESYECNTLR